MHPTQIQVPAEVDTTPARVLRDAATYLDRHGWTRGAFYTYLAGSTMPAACVVGAIRVVVYGRPMTGEALTDDLDALDLVERSASVLAEHLGIDIRRADTDPTNEVGLWNDHPNHTRFDIVEQLRAAADAYHQSTGGAA